MRLKILFPILFCIISIAASAQSGMLTRSQVAADITYLRKILDEKSSYAYLNGYDFNKDFDNYLKQAGQSPSKENFGLFLANTIARIGDRHSSVQDYEPRDSIFLPFMYAPAPGGRVAILSRNKNKQMEFWNPGFPYLTKIDGQLILGFLAQTLPEDRLAPPATYFTRTVRNLRDIQKIYLAMGKPLPASFRFTLSDSSFTKDTVVTIVPVERAKRSGYWDEESGRLNALLKDEDFNKPEIIDRLLTFQNQVAYIQLPSMVGPEDAPLLFDSIQVFMHSIRDNSKALIIDVRNNGGGTRDLTYALARFLVHPDSVYIVNATRQRAPLPLDNEYIEGLHSRNLFAFPELDAREKAGALTFLKTFLPQYALNDKKYSEYYFGVFNGRKLQGKSFHYNKPVYILANEMSFSAASVFVAVFKGLPNVHIAGVTTDGSSGNSERFTLPASGLRVKISTMVSFQKDGLLLDGYGTEPDLRIERDMQQIFWKSDSQLEKLRWLISGK